MMQNDEAKKAREELLAKWKRRQEQEAKERKKIGEQNQRCTEELEREPWRTSNLIKAQDPYHFVINPPTLIERLLGSVLNKAVIDKRTESVTVERRYLFLIHRERIIPFSAVRSVVLDYHKHSFSGQGLPPGEWKVSLNTHGEKITIDSRDERNVMYNLADAISRIINKKLEIDSDKASFSSTDFDFPSSRPPPYSL